MSVSPYLDIHSVTVATISRNTLLIPIKIATAKNEETVEISALIDSGAGGKFIDQNFAKKFKIHKLDEPFKALNVDGTENKRGTIKYYVNLKFTVGNQTFEEQLLVTGLGKQKITLGFPWLTKHNPMIDWKTGKVEWKTHVPRTLKIKRNPKASIEIEEPNDEEHKNHTLNPLDDNSSILIELLEKLRTR